MEAPISPEAERPDSLTFRRGEPDDVKMAARLTPQILANSLRD